MASLSVLNILRTIKERGSVSRTELQLMTNLSWGTVTNTTRDLLNRQLIREEGATATKTGRKPVRLAINPEGHGLIGVDIGRKSICFLMLSLAGETLWKDEISYGQEEEPASVLGRVAEVVQRGIDAAAGMGRVCLGVGVAVPGTIDVKAGVMRFAPHMDRWDNVSARQLIQDKVGPKVYIENNANCLALAERWFGEAGRAEDTLCVNVGEGVGMGILLQGEIFRGSQQHAGEFGHMTLDRNGPLCGCGDHGCVEAYTSKSAILEFIRSHPEKQSPELAEVMKNPIPTISEIIEAARAGDKAALGAFERMGTYLGIGLANLVDLFNPELIILGGGLMPAHEFFMPPLQVEVEKHAWKHFIRNVLISKLGERASAIGACGMVLQSILNQGESHSPDGSAE